ncbi:Methyltransferase-like protein 5 [Schistosoma japonicum]|nr:Methyltransferase-like protein 5 [Schistosoma japonicum]KAH8874988.1 Methyltransferase-like protein 5 [Schistosoma japonicum]
MCTLSRKKLHYYLENVKTFRNPKLEFEQYCTSAQVAADILFNVQMMDGALEGMSVADLGCGTGMLSIGAKLLGASCVLGFEIDEDAVTEFRSNLETYEMLNENINIALCDVVRLFRQNNNKFVDTVILNPPFGTNPDNNGADMAFLHAALSIAHSNVYSLHKTTTRNHVLRTIHNTGAQAKVIAELRFDLPRSYKRHRYDTVDIDVDFIHSWF